MSQKSQAELVEMVSALSPEQQIAVETFIRFIRENGKNQIDVKGALDEFVRDHSELLRRLAQ